MNCKVCFNGTIYQGSLFCEACRSFYRRNQGRSFKELHCKTGSFDCKLDAEDERRKMGSQHTHICRSCRLRRCSEVIHAENQSAMAIVETKNVENHHSELVLKMVVQGREGLVADMKNFHNLSSKIKMLSATDFYAKFMDSFKGLFVLMKSYGNIFPIFSELSTQDRIMFFMSTRFNLIAGEGFIYEDDCYITGCGGSNMRSLITKCQQTQSQVILVGMMQQAYNTWATLQEMKLTVAEQAFLLAFLFFNGNLLTNN